MESAKTIIAFAGRKACGKGIAGTLLVEKHHAYPIDYSSSLHEALNIMGIPDTQSNIAQLSIFLRTRFGADAFQRAVSKKISSSSSELISLFGARRVSDFDSIQKKYRFFLIYIDSNYENRCKRYTSRTKAGDSGLNEEEFRVKDNEEPELQIESLKSLADIVIENNGSFDEFRKKLLDSFAKLGL